jgi:hypothetical protein
MAAVRRSPAELDTIEAEVTAQVAAILSDTTFHPTPGLRCFDCPFSRVCPAAQKS